MVGAQVRMRDESGASLLQTGIAVVLMTFVFLASMNVAMAWYSVTALEAELAEAVTHSNLAAVAASADPAAALEAEILENSYALAAENLVAENVVVTPLGVVEESLPARDVEGSQASRVSRERDRVRIVADVTYEVPSFVSLRWASGVVLETRVDSEVTAETRIEVS